MDKRVLPRGSDDVQRTHPADLPCLVGLAKQPSSPRPDAVVVADVAQVLSRMALS